MSKVVVFKPDGTQEIVEKELPEIKPLPDEPEPDDTAALDERVTALEDAIVAGLALYEGDLGNG